MNSKLVSIAQVAEKLGLCRRTVERLAARGDLAMVRIGRRRLVEEQEIARFIEALKRPEEQPSPQALASRSYAREEGKDCTVRRSPDRIP
jgi:excisionase family DNA binding protein